MRALVLESFGKLIVEERPDPRPAPDEVILRVVATGICGSDIHGYTGENGRRRPGQVMGHEAVGTIAELGSEVTGLTVGQPATFNPVVIPPAAADEYAGREQHAPGAWVIGVRPDISAAFADLVAVPARNVIPLPGGMPIAHGALVEPLSVAVHAVRRAQVTADDTVLVLGGGPIGQSVVLALRMHGVIRILVSEVSEVRRRVLERLGAQTIDPRSTPVDEALTQAFGRRARVAIDAVGIDATLADAFTGTEPGGTVCLVGMGAQRIGLDAYRISTDERTLVGSFTYAARDVADSVGWLATVPELAADLIDREVSVAAAPAAFAALAGDDPGSGKTLVRFD